MSVNGYFSGGQGPGSAEEQELVESNIIELIQMAGQDMYYIPRSLAKVDEFFNEDPLASFSDYKIIEMYCVNAVDYGGQGHMFSKFGLDIQDNIELVVAKRRIREMLNTDSPSEGDLIYFPLMRSIWQIDFIEEETTPFYKLSNLYTFSLKCSRFTYSHEDFDTGIQPIDNIENTYTETFKKNDVIENAAEDFIDFSEDNPFGTFSDEGDSN
jgi:hypothetical protein